MKRLGVVLGLAATALALADLRHGQHNGDAHRFYIHAAELVFFLGFLILLEIAAFRLMTGQVGLDRWLAAVFSSTFSSLAGFFLFAFAGGSAHGDGGPLAFSLGLIGTAGAVGLPISLIGYLAARLKRGRAGTTSAS